MKEKSKEEMVGYIVRILNMADVRALRHIYLFVLHIV